EISMTKVAEYACVNYFVFDGDNFILPWTLTDLVALRLSIVAPLLRTTNFKSYYSTFFSEIDAKGYYIVCDKYQWILQLRIGGLVEVPVVDCTYLIREDVIPQLRYVDGSDRYEFVVLSESARKAGIPQYIDNRELYGFITFDADSDAAKAFVGDEN